MTGFAKRALAHDPALLTEAEFSGLVVELARIGGWKRYHTHFSKRSTGGFPDWVLVKPPRLVVAELKTEVGRLRADQQEWIDTLRQVPGVEVYLWRPCDFEQIAEVLTGRKVRKERAA